VCVFYFYIYVLFVCRENLGEMKMKTDIFFFFFFFFVVFFFEGPEKSEQKTLTKLFELVAYDV
jgi:hypothetical protein